MLTAALNAMYLRWDVKTRADKDLMRVRFAICCMYAESPEGTEDWLRKRLYVGPLPEVDRVCRRCLDILPVPQVLGILYPSMIDGVKEMVGPLLFILITPDVLFSQKDYVEKMHTKGQLRLFSACKSSLKQRVVAASLPLQEYRRLIDHISRRRSELVDAATTLDPNWNQDTPLKRSQRKRSREPSQTQDTDPDTPTPNPFLNYKSTEVSVLHRMFEQAAEGAFLHGQYAVGSTAWKEMQTQNEIARKDNLLKQQELQIEELKQKLLEKRQKQFGCSLSSEEVRSEDDEDYNGDGE